MVLAIWIEQRKAMLVSIRMDQKLIKKRIEKRDPEYLFRVS